MIHRYVSLENIFLYPFTENWTWKNFSPFSHLRFYFFKWCWQTFFDHCTIVSHVFILWAFATRKFCIQLELHHFSLSLSVSDPSLYTRVLGPAFHNFGKGMQHSTFQHNSCTRVQSAISRQWLKCSKGTRAPCRRRGPRHRRWFMATEAGVTRVYIGYHVYTAIATQGL